MASKRELTGGTGDVSPQIFQFPIVNMTGANTFTETSTPVPINRFPESSGRVVIMELLKVYWYLGESDANNSAGGNIVTIQGQLSTSQRGAIDLGNPQVISSYEKIYRGAFTAAGSYQSIIAEPYVSDLTDGSGHGILVATDRLFLGITTSNFVAASFGFCKILYRFKRVSLQEYIGIAQSQT
jgi:hypothetical protein